MRVGQINYQDTKPWLLEKHYAKRIPSISYAFALYDESNLMIGIVTFGKPASPFLCVGICGKEYSSNIYELNRLVLNSDAPKNSASFLVANAMKKLPKDWVIVSYADRGQGHNGYVYQATNFIYTGATKPRTDIDNSKVNGHSRHYDKSEVDYSARKARSSKHRYVFFRNKKMEKLLKYPILPYPKEESKKYECIDIPTWVLTTPTVSGTIPQHEQGA